MKSRIFTKLLFSFLVVIAAATATLDFTLRRAWEKSLQAEITQELIDKTQLFAQRIQSDRNTPLAAMVAQEAQAAKARATVIRRDGLVLADSEANPDKMENHATRPEFKVALAGGTGSSVRWSHTIGIPFLYVAVPLPNGAVRLAYPLSSIERTSATIRRNILLASAFAVVVAMVLAAFLAQAIALRLQRIMVFAEKVAEGDLSARLADSASDEIAQVAMALDRTARKLQASFTALENGRSELETILNGIQDAVLAVTADRKVKWANRSFTRLLARVRVGSPVVETVRDPGFLRALDDSITTREVSTARGSAVVPGRVFDISAAPMPDGGAVCVLHDLTEVERVEKTRRDFIANVSHELRTPLTSLQGYAETLFDTLPGADGTTREFLEIIRKNAQRMTRLTEDLLTLARVESGEQKMEFDAVPASALLEDALHSFVGLARIQGKQLQLAASPSIPVTADRDAIHQVFSNLIENASKYAGTGSTVELGARESDDGVEFYVRDTGPGIPSEHLPRIFERFYRVDKARSSESGGTGLGLSIVKHIVLNHGGRVRVESQLNQGSTFFFVLPFAPASALTKLLAL